MRLLTLCSVWLIGLIPFVRADAAAAPGSDSADMPSVAKKMVDRGDLDGAEISYRELLESGSSTLQDQQEALIGLGRLYRKRGTLAKAAAVYERFLKDFASDSRSPLVMLELGRTLRAMGAYPTAMARFYSVINSTLKLNRDELSDYQVLAKTAQFEIAETHFVMGNYSEAARFFSKLRLLDLAPEDRCRAHFKAGYAHHLNRDREAAVRVLREFVATYPRDENVAEAYSLLATTYWEMNRREDAMAAAMELFKSQSARLESDGKQWAYWQRRTGNRLANDMYQAGEYQTALQLYLRLADPVMAPEWRLPSLYHVGLCHERLKSFKEAREIYQTISELTAKTPASPVLTELGQMAVWRLEHLSWQEEITKKTASLFSTSAPRAAPLGPETSPENDPSRSAKPASGGL